VEIGFYKRFPVKFARNWKDPKDINDKVWEKCAIRHPNSPTTSAVVESKMDLKRYVLNELLIDWVGPNTNNWERCFHKDGGQNESERGVPLLDECYRDGFQYHPVEDLKYLVKCGANILSVWQNMPTEGDLHPQHGYSMLQYAAEWGNEDAVEFLIETFKGMNDMMTTEGQYALKEYVSHDGDMDGKRHAPALWSIAEYTRAFFPYPPAYKARMLRVADMLIKANSPLVYNPYSNKMIRTAPADPVWSVDGDLSAFHIACDLGNDGLVQLFINHGVPVDLRTVCDRELTPIMHVIFRNRRDNHAHRFHQHHKDLVSLLVANGADLAAQDLQGFIAVDYVRMYLQEHPWQDEMEAMLTPQTGEEKHEEDEMNRQMDNYLAEIAGHNAMDE